MRPITMARGLSLLSRDLPMRTPPRLSVAPEPNFHLNPIKFRCDGPDDNFTLYCMYIVQYVLWILQYTHINTYYVHRIHSVATQHVLRTS